MSAAGVIFPAGEGESHPASRVAARFAARQHGRVARRQLLSHGVTDAQIEHLIAAGVLYRRLVGEPEAVLAELRALLGTGSQN